MKHEIIYNGKPNPKNMTKPEFNVFCKTLLDIIIEEKKGKEKSPSEKDGDNSNFFTELKENTTNYN